MERGCSFSQGQRGQLLVEVIAALKTHKIWDSAMICDPRLVV